MSGAPARSYGQGSDAAPHVAFTADSYGGHSGCNAFGGNGLAVGDRWFAEPPMANQQGCSDLEAQESAIFSILSGGPAAARDGPDGLLLRTAGGSLRLRRAAAPSDDRPERPPALLAGTGWELQSLDGAPIGGSYTPDAVRLSFEAERWTLHTPCGSRTGAWRQADGAVSLAPEPAVGGRACAPAKAVAVQALTGALTGELRYVVGFNGELVMANAGHWTTGRRDVRFGREQPDLLAGLWRITSVDGAPLPPRAERPPEFSFDRGYYGVWDGCRHSEGVAIASQRQLFTHGSGVVTMANCPDDPVRTKINTLVAANPRIARTTGGGLALISRAGVLRLQRTSQRSGVGAQTRLAPGSTFDLMGGRGRTGRLTLGPGDRFTLAISCAAIQGRWRSADSPFGPYARFGPDGPPPNCGGPDTDPLYGFFMGDVQAVIGPNRDIALFVSNGESLPARLAPSQVR